MLKNNHLNYKNSVTLAHPKSSRRTEIVSKTGEKIEEYYFYKISTTSRSSNLIDSFLCKIYIRVINLKIGISLFDTIFPLLLFPLFL